MLFIFQTFLVLFSIIFVSIYKLRFYETSEEDVNELKNLNDVEILKKVKAPNRLRLYKAKAYNSILFLLDSNNLIDNVLEEEGILPYIYCKPILCTSYEIPPIYFPLYELTKINYN